MGSVTLPTEIWPRVSVGSLTLPTEIWPRLSVGGATRPGRDSQWVAPRHPLRPSTARTSSKGAEGSWASGALGGQPRQPSSSLRALEERWQRTWCDHSKPAFAHLPKNTGDFAPNFLWQMTRLSLGDFLDILQHYRCEKMQRMVFCVTVRHSSATIKTPHVWQCVFSLLSTMGKTFHHISRESSSEHLVTPPDTSDSTVR